MPTLFTLLAAGLAAACLLMLVVWMVAVRVRNAGIVDVAWAASFPVLVGLYAWLAAGWPPRTALVVVMVALWSVRLTWHLSRRVWSHHPVEDSRYAALRRDHAPGADRWFFWFFQAQAVAAVGLSLPMALARLGADPALASGPVATVLQDILSVAIYLGIASTILHW